MNGNHVNKKMMIHRRVLDILEGTQPAFETREETYFFDRSAT